MSYEIRDGDGALFFAKNKQGKQPDRRGNIRIDGKDYEIAGWNYTTNSGKVLTRLKATLKQPEQAA